MKQVLIIFAQAAEAECAIRRLKAQPIDGEMAHIWSEGYIPCRYRFDAGQIVICNVGILSAQMAVAKYGKRYDEVWNLGLAGSLRDHHPIGELLFIEKVGKYIPLEIENLDGRTQECLSSSFPLFSLPSELPIKGALITSDFPIHHREHRQRLSKEWDLVDMEGYGIAYACSHFNIKYQLWKIVSDFASPGGRELIRKHKKELAEKMGEKVCELSGTL
jgi:adenosylhomocysteine nucleosidase